MCCIRCCDFGSATRLRNASRSKIQHILLVNECSVWHFASCQNKRKLFRDFQIMFADKTGKEHSFRSKEHRRITGIPCYRNFFAFRGSVSVFIQCERYLFGIINLMICIYANPIRNIKEVVVARFFTRMWILSPWRLFRTLYWLRIGNLREHRSAILSDVLHRG